MVRATRHQDTLGVFARAHTVNAVEDVAIGVDQQNIAKTAHRLDDQLCCSISGVVKVQMEDALRGVGLDDGVKDAFTHIFTQ